MDYAEKNLLTVQETAQFLNISVHTVYMKSAPNSKRPFPFTPVRIGRSVRYRKKDLEDFVEKE